MKKILSVMLVISLILVLVACGNKNNQAPANNPPTKETKGEAPNETKKDTSNKTEKQATTIDFGTAGKSGEWEFKILEAKDVETITALRENFKSEGNKFIQIKVSAKNLGKAPKEVGTKFALYDFNSKSGYDVHSDSMIPLNIENEKNGFVGVYDNINPNLTKNIYVTFEVPNDLSLDNVILINPSDSSVGYYLK
ncbi:hypothetical protein SAMN05444401_1716 [Clostridium amylolyticum]|uniref:DUF4352 domain-containing protein n=1 Tax=Clostridium amylolyticum TaxID=1121298 RepID=A0A1M6EVW4_9CLOT|nr:hypothetical protein [Clostridium amylolyticum]SHI89634.1 hypothetical protein SAMN05444401_1716 [Clostridium amylolyticum]